MENTKKDDIIIYSEQKYNYHITLIKYRENGRWDFLATYVLFDGEFPIQLHGSSLFGCFDTIEEAKLAGFVALLNQADEYRFKLENMYDMSNSAREYYKNKYSSFSKIAEVDPNRLLEMQNNVEFKYDRKALACWVESLGSIKNTHVSVPILKEYLEHIDDNIRESAVKGSIRHVDKDFDLNTKITVMSDKDTSASIRTFINKNL